MFIQLNTTTPTSALKCCPTAPLLFPAIWEQYFPSIPAFQGCLLWLLLTLCKSLTLGRGQKEATVQRRSASSNSAFKVAEMGALLRSQEWRDRALDSRKWMEALDAVGVQAALFSGALKHSKCSHTPHPTPKQISERNLEAVIIVFWQQQQQNMLWGLSMVEA